jgi:hypothetical protein
MSAYYMVFICVTGVLPRALLMQLLSQIFETVTNCFFSQTVFSNCVIRAFPGELKIAGCLKSTIWISDGVVHVLQFQNWRKSSLISATDRKEQGIMAYPIVE